MDSWIDGFASKLIAGVMKNAGDVNGQSLPVASAGGCDKD